MNTVDLDDLSPGDIVFAVFPGVAHDNVVAHMVTRRLTNAELTTALLTEPAVWGIVMSFPAFPVTGSSVSVETVPLSVIVAVFKAASASADLLSAVTALPATGLS